VGGVPYWGGPKMEAEKKKAGVLMNFPGEIYTSRPTESKAPAKEGESLRLR